MAHLIHKHMTAFGLAGALALAAIAPVSAAPIWGNASLVSALPNPVSEVRWRGRGGAWIGAGVATGLVLGAVAASRSYYGPGYGSGYYGSGYYDQGYGSGYYAPRYAYGPAPVYEEIEEVPAYAVPRVYAAPRVYGARQPSPDYGGVRQCYVTTNADRGTGYWLPC